MKDYKKIYCNFFGFDKFDVIPSEVSGQVAVDIHHLSPRGMGGSKFKDHPCNLMALTRDEHTRAEKDPVYNEAMKKIHKERVLAEVERWL